MQYRSNPNIHSGVYPVPLFTKESFCGGNCIFCPSDSGLPKSYVANEDTIFAKNNSFSPIIQFSRFIDRLPPHLKNNSLPIEIIILGGSFSSLKREYRKGFCHELYSYMSVGNKYTSLNDPLINWQYRPSVVTVESRPDQIDSNECNFLRELGVTKVELGVQHTSDMVLRNNKRGHTQKAVTIATRILKDEGFKVGYHIMLGLPTASIEEDRLMLVNTLWREEYYPDYLKIYPCVLLKNKKFQPALYKLYRSGKWSPITEKTLLFLLKSLSKVIPRHVRISRIQRQFNHNLIYGGIRPGFRARSKIIFSDVRYREIGKLFPNLNLIFNNYIEEYITKNGNDIFIEFVFAESALLGLARIRIRDKNDIIVRELRIFGNATPVGQKGAVQGNGLGTKLLDRIEAIGQELGASKCLINSSIGANSFYQQRGYSISKSGFHYKHLSMNDIKPSFPSSQFKGQYRKELFLKYS